VKQAQDAIAATAGNGDEGRLVNQIRSLNARLEKSEQRCKALEAALISQDSKGSPPLPPLVAPAPPPQKEPPKEPDPETEAALLMAKETARERERQAVIRGYLRQGLEAERKGKPEAAQWQYGKVLELDPGNGLALQRLGLIASNQGNDLETIRYLQQAFRQDPDNVDVQLALGFALVRQSETDAAISMLSRAVSLDPRNGDAYRAYGAALLAMGWRDAAESRFKRAYELNGKDKESAFNLAVLLSSAEPPRLEEAKQWYQKALDSGAEPDPGLDALLK
jgi:tetratricopeptide (TPR) repeat protein